MHRTAATLRLIVPSLWLGLIIGLSLIEAPLKFTAPGITTPLGLGIGRIMFTALGIAGWFLLVVLVAASLIRPRVRRVDARVPLWCATLNSQLVPASSRLG